MESNELERVIHLVEAAASTDWSDDPSKANLEYRKEYQDKIETLLGILRLLLEHEAEIDEPFAGQRKANLEILYQAQIDAVWPCHQKEIDSLNAQLNEAYAEHAEHEAQMNAQRVKYSELEAYAQHAEHEAQMKAQRVKYSELEAQLKAERVKNSDLEKEITTTTENFAKFYHHYLEMQDEIHCCNQQIASLRETERTMQRNMSKLQSDLYKTRMENFCQENQIDYLTDQLSTQMELHTTLRT